MLKQFIDTGNSLKISGVTSNINERVNYTANTGTAVISTANTNRDGTGTMSTVLNTGATGGSLGTLVKKVTIKGRVSTTRGTVRLFISDGDFYTMLIEEFDIWAVVQSSIAETFCISFDVDWSFGTGLFISASTDKSETFVVTVEALDLTYP